MPFPRARYRLTDILVVILLCALGFALVRSVMIAKAFLDAALLQQPGPIVTENPIQQSMYLVVGIVVVAAIWRVKQKGQSLPECHVCGQRCFPSKDKKGPPLGPQCRRKTFGPAELQRERTNGLRTLAIGILVFAFVFGFLLEPFVGECVRGLGWIVLPLLALGGTLGCIAVLLGVLAVIQVTRTRAMKREDYALSRAAQVGGEPAVETQRDSTTVWSVGECERIPTILDQLEPVRQRFESRLGEPIAVKTPLRILVFAKRAALVDYHRQRLSDLWNLEGVYATAQALQVTLTTEVIPFRLFETDRTARTLFGFYFLESYKGTLPGGWVQAGVAGSVANRAGDREKLNRRVLASIGRGTLPDPELLRMSPWALQRLIGKWTDHDSSAKFGAFIDQARSVVEYLWGEDASGDQRQRFNAFLKDVAPKVRVEEVFERHFGFGYDELLTRWHDAVARRGIGVHTPAPAAIRETIEGSLIPVITDRNARIMDRVRAVRDMGRAGYLVGADALIALLGDNGDLPREEIVLTLELISGQAFGDDRARWTAWWENVAHHAAPADSVGV